MTKWLDGLAVTLTGISWISIIENISSVLACIASLVAIVAGIISIVLKLKDAMSDGKIDESELNDIRESADDVIKDINNRTKDGK